MQAQAQLSQECRTEKEIVRSWGGQGRFPKGAVSDLEVWVELTTGKEKERSIPNKKCRKSKALEVRFSQETEEGGVKC